MIDLDDVRKHVIDDAAELAQTVGMADPLLQDRLEGDNNRASRFFRAELARHVILVVLRLYDPPGRGPTGETASLPAVLKYAVAAQMLSPAQSDQFTSRMNGLKADLEGRGLKFSALTAFRHAELAHSLHRISSDEISHWQVWEFALDTLELIIELDQELVRRGAPAIGKRLDSELDEWRDLGIAFWRTALPEHS